MTSAIVPESGWIGVIARLTQDGEVVAEGRAKWVLGPDIQWTIEIDRGWDPVSAAVNGREFQRHLQDLRDGVPQPPEGVPLPCSAWYCDRTWRIPVREDAANYPEEALWLTLLRWHPDECVDLC